MSPSSTAAPKIAESLASSTRTYLGVRMSGRPRSQACTVDGRMARSSCLRHQPLLGEGPESRPAGVGVDVVASALGFSQVLAGALNVKLSKAKRPPPGASNDTAIFPTAPPW